MAVVFHPPDNKPVVPRPGPFIFTAGPIQGAPNWQGDAFRFLLRDGPPNLVVANPRRDYAEGAFVYEAQVDWETKWLTHAGHKGIIMFWMACQTEETPGRSYAQTSRFELGEWFGRAQFLSEVINDMPAIVVGIEPGFGNERYIRRRISQLLPDNVPLLSTLEDTCAAALEKLNDRTYEPPGPLEPPGPEGSGEDPGEAQGGR